METIVGLAGLWLFLQVAGPILLFALVVYGIYRYMRRDRDAIAPPRDRHEFASAEPPATPHPEVPHRPELGYHPENDPNWRG